MLCCWIFGYRAWRTESLFSSILFAVGRHSQEDQRCFHFRKHVGFYLVRSHKEITRVWKCRSEVSNCYSAVNSVATVREQCWYQVYFIFRLIRSLEGCQLHLQNTTTTNSRFLLSNFDTLHCSCWIRVWIVVTTFKASVSAHLQLKSPFISKLKEFLDFSYIVECVPSVCQNIMMCILNVTS